MRLPGFSLRGFMDLKKIYRQPELYLAKLKIIFRDVEGVILLKGWKRIKKENVETFDQTMLPEILRIQSEGFENVRQGEIIKHSKKFREMFYVIKKENKVIGYCMYYLKPSFSDRRLKKESVIYSIAIARECRHRGFGRKLLEESIKEMKLNKVSAIFLYVNINNTPAVKLYEKTGFLKVKEVENICGQKERCYKMELRLI